jgi:threonylcarbamoyladenosine tRNA methylthiotransferase MtaB
MADQKSRHLVRMVRRIAPNATVALTGCLLETGSPEKLDALGANLAYRQPDQLALADRLIELYGRAPAGGSEVLALTPALSQGEREFPAPTRLNAHPSRPQETTLPPLPQGEGWGEGKGHGAPKTTSATTNARAYRTRAFIAAQEGCNDVCAFCIIPKTRGRERSKTIEWVVSEAQKREAEGVQEIVITGTQLGHYGSDIGVRLSDLMKALLAKTSIPRIRMSSVQPQDLDDALIRLWDDARLCRHYHLALQSGSEGVLQRMRRRYTQDEVCQAVRQLRSHISGIAITTDVIAGFPGETAEEFEECLDFCEEMAFAGIHVFPYSQRSGTVAHKLPGQLPDAVKKQRVHRLIDLGAQMSREYRSRYVGTTMSVLWETRHEDDTWEGLTDTYVRVRARSHMDLWNRITSVRMAGLSDDGLIGEVLT